MKGASMYMKFYWLFPVLRKKFIWDNLIFLALEHFLLFDWVWSN